MPAGAAAGSKWSWIAANGPLRCDADSDRIVEGTELWIKCYSTKTFPGATIDFNVVWTQLGRHEVGYRFNTWRLTFLEGTKANYQQAVKIFIPDDGIPENSNKVLKIWGKMSLKVGTKSIFGIPIWVTTEEEIFYKTLRVDDDDRDLIVTATPTKSQEGTIRALELKANLSSGDNPPSGLKVDVEVGASDDTATEGTDYTTIPKQTLTFDGSSREASTRVTLNTTGFDGIDPGETISVTGTVLGDYASLLTVHDSSISITDVSNPDITLQLSVPDDPKQATARDAITVCENGGYPSSTGDCGGGSSVNVRLTATVRQAYAKARTVLVKVGGAHGDTAVADTHFGAVGDFDLTIAANALTGTQDFRITPYNDTDKGHSKFLTVHGQETGTDSLGAAVSSATVNLQDDDWNAHTYDLPDGPLVLWEWDGEAIDKNLDFDVGFAFDSNSPDGTNNGLTCAWQANYAFVASGTGLPTLANPATPTTDPSTTPGDFRGGSTTTYHIKIPQGTKDSFDPAHAMKGLIYGDQIYEGDESFYAHIIGQKCQGNTGQTAPVRLHDHSNYRQIIIRDDELPDIRLKASVNSVNEDRGKQTVTVTAEIVEEGTTFATEQTITVAVGSSGDTATEGVDYKTVDDLTITIPVGQTSGTATFDLEPIDDAQTERETISLIGSSATLPSSAYIYNADIDVVDLDWPMALTVSPATVFEDGTGPDNSLQHSVKLTVTGPGVPPLEAIDLKVSVGKKGDTAVGGKDYGAITDFTMTLTPDQVSGHYVYSQTFNLTVIDDSVDEGIDDVEFEEITIHGVAVPASKQTRAFVNETEISVTGTKISVKDNDTADFSISVSPLSVAEGTEAEKTDSKSHTMTVTVAANTTHVDAKTVTIDVGEDTDGATSGTDYTAVSQFEITVPAGEKSATGTFTFTPTDDTDFEGTETVTVHGTSGSYDVISGSFELTDDDYPVVRLDFTPKSVREDANQPTVTVGAQWNGDYTYDKAMTFTVSFGENSDTAVEGATCTTGVDYRSISDLSMTIKKGEKGETSSFIFRPCDDSLDEGTEYLSMSGSYTNTSGSSKGLLFADNKPQLAIQDDDRLSIDISLDPISFAEGDKDTTVTVTAEALGLGTGSVQADSTGQKIEVALAVGAKDDTATHGTDFAKVTAWQVDVPQRRVAGRSKFIFSPEDDSAIEGTELFTVVGTATVSASEVSQQRFAGASGASASERFSVASSTTAVDVTKPARPVCGTNDLPAPGLSVSPATITEKRREKDYNRQP